MECSLDESETIAINFQGIELKDLIDDGDRDLYPPLSEYELFSDQGVPFRIYAPKENKKKYAIITVHDIGMNHESFLGFFNSDIMRVILQRFSVYHICMPGHHQHAGTLANELNCELDLPRGSIREEKDSLLPGGGDESIYTISGASASSSPKKTNFMYPTMDNLADLVEIAVAHFNLRGVVAIGSGAGSNVLARYALKSPPSLLGLFLINPNDSTHSYYPWFKAKMSYVPQLQKGFISEGLMTLMENHWFGCRGSENLDLLERYHQDMRKLNSHNVAGYIMSYLNRTDLGLVRELDPAKREFARCIEIDATLVSGEHAVDLARAMTDMNGRMDPSKTQFITVTKCSGMVMEEDPNRLGTIFLNFLRNLGLVINLTPEKAKEEAIKLRSQLAVMEAQNAQNDEGGDQATRGLC